MYRVLLDELIALKGAMSRYGLPLMIGGGMGLFLRETYHPHERQPRYPVPLPGRSTQDLDVFLSADLIVDAEAMEQLRDCVAELGYKPLSPYFQFIRVVERDQREVKVKIDLLAAPPRDADRAAVKVSKPRIRPVDAKGIHAYLTDEAEGIDRGRLALDLSSVPGAEGLDDTTIYVPSSYNYLILKLHAFDDRKDQEDEQSDRGRHHALDIFRIVIDMSEEDWRTATSHLEDEGDADYLQKAREIRRAYFADESAVGFIRMRENEAYRARRGEYDGYIANVIEDLAELLP